MTTVLISLAAMATAMSVSEVVAQTAREIRGPAGVIPLASKPPAKIIIDPPLPDALARGLVAIQYRTENLRIVQVFGPGALDVSPRIGHIHVTVDDAPWHWADASGEPLIIQSLPPGPHKVLIQLADPTHRVIDQGVVELVIPER
jgi:Family of unknown function (DUF6130)